ncbi:hypothetical protein [Roseovarius sp.]
MAETLDRRITLGDEIDVPAIATRVMFHSHTGHSSSPPHFR